MLALLVVADFAHVCALNSVSSTCVCIYASRVCVFVCVGFCESRRKFCAHCSCRCVCVRPVSSCRLEVGRTREQHYAIVAVVAALPSRSPVIRFATRPDPQSYECINAVFGSLRACVCANENGNYRVCVCVVCLACRTARRLLKQPSCPTVGRRKEVC